MIGITDYASVHGNQTGRFTKRGDVTVGREWKVSVSNLHVTKPGLDIMQHEVNSIHHLIGDLSAAIRIRSNRDRSFDYLGHFFVPFDYVPSTSLEEVAWEGLTTPENREALLRYPDEFRRMFGSELSEAPYGSHLFRLILDASTRRAGDSSLPKH